MMFDGKSVVVTGAGSGIGRGIALRFAQEGAAVVVNDVVAERAAGTVEMIVRSGGAAIACVGDVAERATAEHLLDVAADEFGDCHVVINNAGVMTTSPLLELREQDWDRVMRINVRGTFLLTQGAARRWVRDEKSGRIVNIASVQAEMASTMGLAHYGASKGAVKMFTRMAAAELAPHGINVNAIGPGTIPTQIAGVRSEEEFLTMKQSLCDATPVGRPGTAADIAGLAAFLCSPDAAYITGQLVLADGGRNLTAGRL